MLFVWERPYLALETKGFQNSLLFLDRFVYTVAQSYP